MIYPSAFKYVSPRTFPLSYTALILHSTTTGPIYWTLLQRARYAPSLPFLSISCVQGADEWSGRAVDNQIYVAMCSPARHPDASYQAVSAPPL